jgi:AcrR family transcriptional regulator
MAALVKRRNGLIRCSLEAQNPRRVSVVSKSKGKRARPIADRHRPPPPAPADGQRARQKLATRERIRDAAWELFNRDGYEATTTKAVAARARVAAGTVFVHARDKEDLLMLVMSDVITESVDKAFQSLPEGAPFIDRVLHLFRGPVSHYARHPRVARALLRAIPGADGPNAQKMNAETFAFIHRLAGLVQDASARGELARDVDAALAARTIFALYYVSLMGWMTGYSTLDTVLDPNLREALGQLVRGLRP